MKSNTPSSDYNNKHREIGSDLAVGLEGGDCWVRNKMKFRLRTGIMDKQI